MSDRIKEHSRHLKSMSAAALEKSLRLTAQAAASFASARLSLNLPAFIEELDTIDDERQRELFCDVDKILLSLLTDDDTKNCEECRDAILKKRDVNIEYMKKLDSYADHFKVYEYVLNRIEYRFISGSLPDDYSDENMTQKIIASIAGVNDKSLSQSMILSVVEELPFRMTKQRFYEIISNGLNAYSGSDEAAVDGLIYMLRSTALLSDSSDDRYKIDDFESVIQEFSALEVSAIAPTAFDELSGKLQSACSRLLDLTDNGLFAQEILNDSAVIAILKSQKLLDMDEAMIKSISTVCEIIEKGIKVSDDSSENGFFESLEGVQEKAAAVYSARSALTDEYRTAYANELESAKLSDGYKALAACSRLLSQSSFAQLEEKLSVPASDSYIDAQTQKLISELKEQFSCIGRLQSRAVMSKLITLVPFFLRTQEQLEDYILTSLQSCSDLAEKIGCIEIINSVISDGV